MSVDRLERRLPEVLAELSLPRVPDYTDTLLSRTERMSQRPGWTFPERWIPVSTITDALSFRRPMSLRPLIVLAIVAALIAGALLIYVGTQRRPPLFGPAGNGSILTMSNGDIVLLDPESGQTRTLVSGDAGNICCPAFTPLGTQFDYFRLPPTGDDPLAWVIANIDGTTIHEFPGSMLARVTHGEWSPDGNRELFSLGTGAQIVDIQTGTVTQLDGPGPIRQASWIGTTGDILLSQETPGQTEHSAIYREYRLPAGSTANPEHVVDLPFAVFPPIVSPDGTKFVYFVWGVEDRTHGRLHVFDFATRVDTAITPEDAAADAVHHEVEAPMWSPDGTKIAAIWFFEGYEQIGITPAAGGETVFVGPKPEPGFGDFVMRFAPDGKSILVRYGDEHRILRVPVDGGAAEELPWTLDEEWHWQRTAF